MKKALKLELAEARLMVAAAIAKAHEIEPSRLRLTVTDDGGRPPAGGPASAGPLA